MPTALEKIAELVRNSNACPNKRYGHGFPGRGLPSARIMVVMEKPSIADKKNDAIGTGSEMLFTYASMKKAGIKSEDVYVTSIAKFFPGRYKRSVKPVTKKCITACEPFLEAEIEVLKPELIVAVGEPVMRWFGIGGGSRQNAGKIFDTKHGKVLVILHPATLWQNKRDIWQFVTQMHAIPTYLRGAVPPPQFTSDIPISPTFGLDVETEMLDEGNPLWSVGIANDRGRYAWKYAEGQDLSILEKMVPVLHNAKFDIPKLAEVGVHYDTWYDTIVEAHLLGYRPLALKELAPVFLGVQGDKFKDIVGTGKAQKRLDEVDEGEVLDYNAMDAWMSHALHEKVFLPEIKRRKLEHFLDKERDITKVLISMEKTGLPVEQSRLKWLSKQLMVKMARSEDVLEQAGLDPSSREGFARWFWRGKSRVETTKKGRLSTQGAHLRENADREQLPIVNAFLNWHQARQFKSTYADGWKGMEWVHPSINQTATATWRFSCSNPNFQNVPKNKDEKDEYTLGAMLYQTIVAPEGYLFISCDYSQIELRLMSVLIYLLTGETAMMDVYREGRDLHDETSQNEKVIAAAKFARSEVRRFAKTINFGIPYGMTEKALSKRLKIPEMQALKMIEGFFETYSGAREMQEEYINFAARHGYIETIAGRPIWIPGINSKDWGIKGHAENEAKNFPIQAGAAEIVKDAMVRCPEYLIMQVHDELLYLVPEKEVKDYGEHLKANLVDNRHPIPYTTDFHVGKTWGDIKEIPEISYGDEEEDD